VKISHLIQNRNCWPKDGEREKVIGGRVPLNVVYDEMGTVHCYDTTGAVPIRRAMSYAGHEKDRGQLKYRCPARVEGFECGSEHKCNVGKSYGLTVRVDQVIDLCRFPSITRATKPFERRYKGRTAVERVNDRLKVFWGLDDGNVVGSRRFLRPRECGIVGTHGLCDGVGESPAKGGSFGTMRLSPIAKKLHGLSEEEKAGSLG